MEKTRNIKIIAIIITIVMTVFVFVGCYAVNSSEYLDNSVQEDTVESPSESEKDTDEEDKDDKKNEEENKEEDKKETTNIEETTTPKAETPTNQTTPPATETPQQKPVTPTTPPVTPEVTPPPVNTVAPSGKYIVGYYASWAPSSGLPPASIDAKKLTHINYAFADISSGNELILRNSSVDLKNFEGLRNLKTKNPSLKLIISVGGWDGSKYFSNAALTKENRETFANSCVDFVVEHGFDGVDLDWEYPVSGGMANIINRPEDKQNFTKLLATIREKLNAQSAKDGKQYFLTIAGATSTSYIKNIELKNILQYIDYIFIMGYDMHGPWDSYADFNAPLYVPNEKSPQYIESVDGAIRNYINAGASASKLVLGMPYYGYKYTVTSNDNYGLFQRFSKANAIGYNKIVNQYLSSSSYEMYRHSDAKVPYLFGNNTFITYEDATSISAKVKLAKSYKLAGVGAWELSHDTKGVLLSSTYNTLNS